VIAAVRFTARTFGAVSPIGVMKLPPLVKIDMPAEIRTLTSITGLGFKTHLIKCERNYSKRNH
jgi:hypothetical protein